MARIKGGMNAKKKHKRVLKLAKGYRGARSKQYRVAKQSVMRALEESYTGRKQKKRQFRQLWIARINAAARINGLSYSKFMYGLKLAEVNVNRSHTESQPDSIRYTAPVCDTDPAGPHPCGHGSTNRDTQELCAGLTESQVRQEQPERDSLQKSKREKGI